MVFTKWVCLCRIFRFLLAKSITHFFHIRCCFTAYVDFDRYGSSCIERCRKIQNNDWWFLARWRYCPQYASSVKWQRQISRLCRLVYLHTRYIKFGGSWSLSILESLYLATDFLIDGRRIGCLEGPRITTGGLELGTQITPRGWIFWTIIFYHQKIQVKIYLMRGQTLLWVH